MDTPEYLSEKDKTAWDSAKRKRCVRCGQDFPVSHANTKYCSPCATDIRVTGRTVVCTDCSKEFAVKGNVATKRCQSCRIVAEQTRKSRRATARADGRLSPQVSTSQSVGAAGELLFDVLCVRNGWLSAKPILDTNPGWDRLVIRDQIAERIQIKSIATICSQSTKTFRSERPINAATCDVVVVVDVDTADVWMIPVDLLPATFHASDWDSVRSNAIGIPP